MTRGDKRGRELMRLGMGQREVIRVLRVDLGLPELKRVGEN